MTILSTARACILLAGFGGASLTAWPQTELSANSVLSRLPDSPPGSPKRQASPPATPHYDIRVKLSPATATLSAIVTIRIATSDNGTERRFLLGRSFTIDSLEATGADVSLANVDQPFRGLRRITVLPRSEGEVTVKIAYSGPLAAFVSPPMNAISPELVELSVDSFWMPFPAELGSPFTAEAQFRGIPSGATIVSSDPFELTDDGLRIRRTVPAGDLNIVAAPGLQRSIDERFVFYATNLDTEIARYFRLHGAGSLAFLERMLGPMPTPTASIAIVRRASRSGYARPGYIIVTEKVDATPLPGDAKFIAHELSHSWFSRANFLTEDYWLVETPAEYLGLRYVQETLGDGALEELLAPKRAAAVHAGPILGGRRAGSAELYAKGPLLFFELEGKIGRSNVDRVLGELGRTQIHTTAVFFDILRRVAGDDAARELEAKMRGQAASLVTQPPGAVNNGGLPSASPDGKRVTFISNRDGTYDIYVVGVDGTGLVRVTDDTLREGAPSWTSDSREVLFSVRNPAGAKLFAVIPESVPRQVASLAGNGPALSPDRSLIAFSAGPFQTAKLTIVRVDGSGSRELTDGKQPAFNSAWSPDGKRIAFAMAGPDGTRRLTSWVINVDGRGATPVGSIPVEEGSPQWPAWSPDGKRLAVQVGKYDRNDPTKNIAHIWVIEIATGVATKLAAHDRPYLDETPTWIDDHTIAFQSDRTGRMEIWVSKSDGTGARQLTR